MAYAQDTIISVNAPNTLQAVLDGLMLAAGWEVVETLTPSTTYRTKVYKSDGALNQCGYDWYVAILWNSVGTEQQMEVLAGSSYNDVTHTLSGIAGRLTGTGSSPAYSDAVGDNMSSRMVNVATNTTPTFLSHGTNTTKPWFANIVPSSAFAYWASVTLDHFALYTTISVLSTGTPSFIVGTLDVDAGWNAHGFSVVENPVVNFGYLAGISGTVPGTGTSNADYRNPTADYTKAIGALLPALSNSYLPAFAWRPEFYLSGIIGAGPAWSTITGLGDGFRVGAAIDWYVVYGGSVGDTVTIDSATYVISGPLPFGLRSTATGVDTAVSLAVLVEA